MSNCFFVLVLIESDWNLKSGAGNRFADVWFVLIESDWNLKVNSFVKSLALNAY